MTATAQTENTETKTRDARRAAADKFFENFDFGDSTVTDSGQWEDDGIYWSRRIYGDSEDGTRFWASFGVEFDRKTTKVIDSWVEPGN